MTLYGYARVSVREPEDKNLDLQVERLVRAGCSLGNIRAEEASGARNDRGGLLELLDLVVEGDTLVVTHIDRLSRGLTHGLQVIEGLHRAGVEFRSLVEIMDRIDGERLPDDWLALSSAVLADILTEAVAGTLPIWCQKVTWLEYAEKRYDRVKARLIGILRESAYAKSVGEVPNGWTVDGNRIIVWEPRDAFGRRGFDWEDVPPL